MNGFTLFSSLEVIRLLSGLHVYNGTIQSSVQFVREMWHSSFENITIISSNLFIEYVRTCEFSNVVVLQSGASYFIRDIDDVTLTNCSFMFHSKLHEYLRNSQIIGCHYFFNSSKLNLAIVWMTDSAVSKTSFSISGIFDVTNA